MPARLTEAEHEILVAIADASFHSSRGSRVKASPARARLKRVGFIESRPPNDMVLLPAVGGKGHFWRLTDAGRAALGDQPND